MPADEGEAVALTHDYSIFRPVSCLHKLVSYRASDSVDMKVVHGVASGAMKCVYCIFYRPASCLLVRTVSIHLGGSKMV